MKSVVPLSSALHRRVVLEARVGHCTAAVEDDFHHFRVSLRHDGHQVLSVEAQASRTPWSLCPQAMGMLQQFVGQGLTTGLALQIRGIDSKQHCTHQYDLALMALVHSLRPGRRDYTMTVTDPVEKHRQARLWRDGKLLINWSLNKTEIASDDAFHGRDLRNLLPWAAATLNQDLLETAYLMRRAVLVSGGRVANLVNYENAGQAMVRMAGGCYVFQPERAALALRAPGSIRSQLLGHAQLLPELNLPTTPF